MLCLEAVTDEPATMIDPAPTHASQLMRASVWILENMNAIMAATATKIAVHTEWSDSALNAIEMLSMAEPETNIQSGVD